MGEKEYLLNFTEMTLKTLKRMDEIQQFYYLLTVNLYTTIIYSSWVSKLKKLNGLHVAPGHSWLMPALEAKLGVLDDAM